MPQINIPKTIDEAKAGLDGLGALLTAKQWERAAIVYAFTDPGLGQGARGPRGETTPKFSLTTFAELGITGLRDKHQVRLYRKAWESAMEDGAPDVQPGDMIDVPALPWKDHFGEPTKEVQERVARSFIQNDPHAIDKIVHDNPSLAGVIADGVIANPATLISVEARLRPAGGPRTTTHSSTPPTGPDYRADLVNGTNRLIRVVRAIEAGEYTPTGAEEMLLGLVGQMLVNHKSGTSTPRLFDQIDAYLRGTVAP